jgi:predicted kinase
MGPVTTTDDKGGVKPQLVMLMGLPASGKTTYAKGLVDQGNFVRVNKDELRAMMDNSVHSKSNEKRVIRIRDQIIIDALANGKNVIVDDTNFAKYHQETLYGLAQKMGATMIVRFLDTPVEMCIERNNARGNPVPNSAITEMYDKYILPTKKVEKPVDETEQQADLEECIIVDVDGTLAHIDSSNPRNIYDASRAAEDLLDDAVGNVVGMAYQNGYRVVIFSGRSRAHQAVTEEWLKLNNVPYDEIHTRMDGDKRADTIVKKEMYQAFIQGKYHVKYVIDDRPSVCRMWRNELGLKVFQVGDPHREF